MSTNLLKNRTKSNCSNVLSKEKEIKRDIFSITEDYLKRHYDIRYNSVSNDYEIKTKDAKMFSTLNEKNLFIELFKQGIRINDSYLKILIGSDFFERYDPFVDYFQNLPKWNGEDHILRLCSFITAREQDQFNYHLKKWLVRLVATAIDPQYFNKQIFVFVSQEQNNGKSTLSRFFCPNKLNDYLAENISLDKDSRILLAKSILINMDELSTFSTYDINSLKGVLSKVQINERMPYGKKNIVLDRKCSFIGNTNEFTLLKDETGRVRWLCFEIDSINWDYSKIIDIDKIYSQAYALYKSGNFNYEMTYKDIQENELRNKKFFIPTVEMELISKYFEADDEKESSNFYQATDVLRTLQELEKIKYTLSNIKIGKALTAIGYKRIKFKDRYGYYLKLKS